MGSGPRAVRIRLFASAREAVGAGVVDLGVPARGLAADALVARLGATYPRLRAILRTARFVRNGEYLTNLDARIRPGYEFAVHPPYGGG